MPHYVSANIATYDDIKIGSHQEFAKHRAYPQER